MTSISVNQNLIEIKDLSYSISKNTNILENINFNIEKNQILFITGDNGVGKTTLIKILMGFIKSYSGNIKHSGSTNYSYVPQNFEIPDYINIDVESFLKFTDAKNGIFSFDEAIEILGIKDYLKINLKKISGGQLRKVLIAKSLIGSNEVLFLDEPTCWLDQKSQDEFYELIKKIKCLSRITIVIVTHDKNLIESDIGNVIFLSKNGIKIFEKEGMCES
jgi:zinc transport system ATP-binding protein